MRSRSLRHGEDVFEGDVMLAIGGYYRRYVLQIGAVQCCPSLQRWLLTSCVGGFGRHAVSLGFVWISSRPLVVGLELVVMFFL